MLTYWADPFLVDPMARYAGDSVTPVNYTLLCPGETLVVRNIAAC